MILPAQLAPELPDPLLERPRDLCAFGLPLMLATATGARRRALRPAAASPCWHGDLPYVVGRRPDITTVSSATGIALIVTATVIATTTGVAASSTGQFRATGRRRPRRAFYAGGRFESRPAGFRFRSSRCA